MSLSQYQSLLLNGLSGQLQPGAGLYLSPDRAHSELVKLYMVDFGKDVGAWREWIERRPGPAFKTGVLQLMPVLLRTFSGGSQSQDSLPYDKETAYRMLREALGVDFGYDADAWRQWLQQHPDGD